MTTSQGTDIDVQETVYQALASAPGVSSSYITVAVHLGAVTLSGEVDSYPEKAHAEHTARAVPGVTTVDEKITVRSLWAVAGDSVIAAMAHEALDRADGLPVNAVEAAVHHRVVTLSGSTSSQQQRIAAARAVEDVSGVSGVINEVTVSRAVKLG